MSTSHLLRSSARPYLFTLAATIVIAKYVSYLREHVWPEIPLIKSHAPIIYVAALGVCVAGILWLLYRGRRTRSNQLQWLLGLLVVTWFVHIIIAISHGDLFPISAFLYVPVVLALWLKTPTALDFTAALRFLGVLVASLLVITRALEMLGLIPMLDVGQGLVDFEVAHYWLPLSGTIGPEGRWPGPGGHNAMTGNSGAMLVVLAAGLQRYWRWGLGLVGVLTLLLTSSRNSYLAVIVGVALIVVTGDNWLTRRVSRKALIGSLAAGVAVVTAYVLILNPNLTGRTTYWTLFFDLWMQNPLTGVGGTGISQGDPTISGTNGHNLVVDSLVRYGLIGAFLVVAIIVIALIIVLRAGRVRIALPLGIVGAFMTIGLVESDINWLGFSELWLWLILAVGLAAQSLSPTKPLGVDAGAGAQPPEVTRVAGSTTE